MDFANSVINAAAGQTAIWHGLDGVNSTIAGGVTAGLSALAYATDLIAAGRAEVLLAGGADELCLESFLGFARAGLTCHVGDEGERPVPFDARRNGFAPAEAGALLVLEEAEAAARRGATVLAEIRGHGNAFDPSRGRDDGQAAAALGRAVRLALADGGAEPAAVDAVSAGASGSVAGDRQEAHGLAEGLGAEVAGGVPVTAVKAMLGEGLGASGALQTVALIQAMGTGTLPGIAGLEEAEAGLPLGSLSADSRSLPLRCALVTGLGFEGNAVALLLGRGEAAG
jgi:3-oxoacyl-(acyl-carrier-protein) synthase